MGERIVNDVVVIYTQVHAVIIENLELALYCNGSAWPTLSSYWRAEILTIS